MSIFVNAADKAQRKNRVNFIFNSLQGFKHIFGEDAEERFGKMSPIPQEKFVWVEDGDSIPLGGRELKAINTSGHAPQHFSFLDTGTRGLFCGDAFGGYFPEIEVILPSSTPGSDPNLTLKSMEKLQELNPEFVFFSHGSSTREAAKILQLGVDQARQCRDIALEALKAGEDGKLSVGPVYRNILAKNGFPPLEPGITTSWDVFR